MAETVLNCNDIDRFMKEKSREVVTKSMRRKARKVVRHRTMDEPRVRGNACFCENKWKPGGAWPQVTVALEVSDDMFARRSDGPAMAALQGEQLEADRIVDDGHVTIRKITNLLTSRPSEKKGKANYSGSKLLKIFYGICIGDMEAACEFEKYVGW